MSCRAERKKKKDGGRTVGAYNALDYDCVIVMVRIGKKVQLMHFHRADGRLPVSMRTLIV